jgi:spore germination protein YaaH
MKNIILSVIWLFAGLVSGLILIVLFGILPLRFDNPIVESLGISRPQIVGFAPYWLLDKSAPAYGKNLSTYTYFGLIVGPEGKIVKMVNDTEEEPGWTTLSTEKFQNNIRQAKKDNLKLSLLVQSGNEDAIAALLTDPEKSAANLVADVAPVMREHGFTDLNLDIESFVESSPSSQVQFTGFVRAVKHGIDQEKLGTLTVELTPYALIKTRLTDPAGIGQLADTVILMAYDYTYSGSYLTGPVAPVGGAGSERPFDVENAIRQALRVIAPEKLVLGIPLYGYEWETVASSSGAAVIPGTSKTASSRRVSGMLNDCPDCITGVDPTGLEPFVIFPDGEIYHQIFFEDQDSLKIKLDLARKYRLGGAAFWALGYEADKMLTPLESYKSWWTVRY